MSKTQHGGARPGAGRPPLPKPFGASKGDFLLMERETIGGEIRKPELVTVLSVNENEIELQSGNDIIVIRVPDAEEITGPIERD